MSEALEKYGDKREKRGEMNTKILSVKSWIRDIQRKQNKTY